jgi:hypothetical protein
VTDLRDFIAARLEEDEATARAACWDGHDDSLAAQWDCGEEKGGRYWWVGDQWDDGVVKTSGDAGAPAGQAAHIARHDPARVLREVAAKREMLAHAERSLADVDKLEGMGVQPAEVFTIRAPAEWMLSILAAPYEGHPDYRKEWAA